MVNGYGRYLGGQAVSLLGDQVWYVALSWSAVQLASPSVAGVVVAVSALPRLAFLLLGGAAVDRYDARRLMIGSDLLRCAVVLAAAAFHPGLALLITVALVFGTADAVFLPAAATMPPRLLPPDRLRRGAALAALTSRLALMIGAPLGGLLVSFGGLPVACLVDAATFLVSVLALHSVHPRPVAGHAQFALRPGFRYLRSHRVLRSLILVMLLTNLGFVGPMNVGLALVSTARGWGATGVGALLAGFGGGAVAGSLVMLRLHVRHHLGPFIAAGAVIQATAVFAIAVVPTLPTAVAATVLVGAASSLIGVLSTALSQSVTDDTYRGRVGSVSSFANLGITPIAIALTGTAVGTFGITATFAASAAVEVTAAALCLSVPALRRATL